MARSPYEDIIRELTRDIAILKEQLASLGGETADIPDLTLRFALLEQQITQTREGWTRWAQRVWMVIAPVLGGATGALLTYYLKKWPPKLIAINPLSGQHRDIPSGREEEEAHLTPSEVSWPLNPSLSAFAAGRYR